MDLKGVHNFLANVEKQLDALGIESTYVSGTGEPQIGDTLRILLPITEEGHAAVTEIMITNIAGDLDLLMLYSTIIVVLNERKGELPQKLNEWNQLCPLGAYSIYEQEQQLSHKYTVPFDRDMEPDALADYAMTLLELLHSLLSVAYPDYSVYASDD